MNSPSDCQAIIMQMFVSTYRTGRCSCRRACGSGWGRITWCVLRRTVAERQGAAAGRAAAERQGLRGKGAAPAGPPYLRGDEYGYGSFRIAVVHFVIDAMEGVDR